MSKRLPEWLRPAAPKRPHLETLGRELAGRGVHTVCQSARCPNLGECFGKGTATFLILGNACTRNCRFCAVEHGPSGPPDPEEPRRVAEAARMLNLKFVVLTSVTRRRLAGWRGGAFRSCHRGRARPPAASRVEVLAPDFQGDRAAVDTVLQAGPDVFGHNVETVPRLYCQVRPQADYAESLRVLQWAREVAPEVVTKSGLMVGMGEGEEEVLQVLRDLRGVGVQALTIGQYLAPSRAHVPVVEYVTPETFTHYAGRPVRWGSGTS